MSQDIENKKEARKKVIQGLIWCLICIAFYFNGVRENFKEYTLIKKGKPVIGQITKCYGGVDDEGINTDDICFYSFELDEHVLEGKTNESKKELDMVEIEYLADNPEINRLKGEGGTTVYDWIWQRVLDKTIFLTLFLFPGILLTRNGLNESKIPKQTKLNKT